MVNNTCFQLPKQINSMATKCFRRLLGILSPSRKPQEENGHPNQQV